ncbi:MAG TPA: pyrroloquinoline quinone biosynthesis peptide chaperone PqqD [Burkholderiales bacterium]|nr:pyrroloquinoline quinone biosynthesis peptide chaperone PqqD [Burkholderiales bacterium]
MTEPATDAAMRPELNPMFLFRWEDTQDSYVLLYPEGVVKLNATAGEILKRCTGEASLAEMIDELKALFAGPPKTVEQGVRRFLEVSHAKGWIRYRT